MPFTQIALSCPSLCPFFDKSEYNCSASISSSFLKNCPPLLPLSPSLSLSNEARAGNCREIRRRAVSIGDDTSFRLVPPGDSASQNVRILKHDKHSEITIRATLGYELRRQTGEFLTLHDPWANLGCTRAFSRAFSRCANPCRVN